LDDSLVVFPEFFVEQEAGLYLVVLCADLQAFFHREEVAFIILAALDHLLNG
jgi:hypothetical protein